MLTHPLFDWQIVDDKEWAVVTAAGVSSGDKDGNQSDATTADPGHRPSLSLISLVSVAVAVILMWMTHALWSAQRADALPPDDDNSVMTPHVLVEAKDGYLRFSPIDSAHGGPQRLSILSDYFQFEYDLLDRSAVTAVARQIDPHYRTLRHIVGLDEPASVLKINVSPRAMATGWQLSADTIMIPSPGFLHLPAEYAAETLMESLHMALINVVLTQRLADDRVHPHWNFLVDGLRQWMQTCLAAPGGRHCNEPIPPSTTLSVTPPLLLADLVFTGPDWVATTWRVERIQAAESLVAYIVEAHGVEKLPLLLDGLRQHNSWQTLIPAVFDQSVDQFETAWRTRN